MSIAKVPFPQIDPIPDESYKTIVADPPWQYNDSLSGDGRGAESHYETLPTDVVRAMGTQVNRVAANHAHCYLWTTNAFLGDAYDVLKAWNFTPKTVITWIKVLDEPDGLPHERDDPADVTERIGMGHYYRNTTEHIVFGVKGRKSTNSNSVPTHFFAERTEHSAKPEKSYDLIEHMSDEPRLELFARNERDGWTTWGRDV